MASFTAVTHLRAGFTAAGPGAPGQASAFSMRSRRLRGRMSVQTLSLIHI
ncbi:hypothetical protein [Streptomyces fragilis]|nr:hypothetical protein [Streptomyces fragilis]